MKIVHINTSASRGGAALIAKRLHLWLRDAKFNSYFISARDPAEPQIGIFTLNQTYLRFLLNVIIYRIFGIEGFFNRYLWRTSLTQIGNFDVIHLHNAHGYYLPFKILLKFLKGPVVWTLHDYWLATGGMAINDLEGVGRKAYPFELINRSKWRQLVFRKMVEQSNPVLVVPSHSAAKVLVSKGLPNVNLHVVYHGIFDNIDGTILQDRKLIRRKLNWNDDVHVFVFASSTVDNISKGFHVLLSALSKLKTNRRWMVYVVGDSAVRSKKLVRDLGIAGINFTGVVGERQIKELFCACDSYVTASFSETFGLTVIEALGEGARVVCTDLPVFREVTAGYASFFPAGDIDALTNCLINELDASSDLERWMRSSFIRQRFSKDNMVVAYSRLYELAVKQRLALQ